MVVDVCLWSWFCDSVAGGDRPLVSMNVCMCMHICVCLYMCMHVYGFACLYLCVYVCFILHYVIPKREEALPGGFFLINISPPSHVLQYHRQSFSIFSHSCFPQPHFQLSCPLWTGDQQNQVRLWPLMVSLFWLFISGFEHWSYGEKACTDGTMSVQWRDNIFLMSILGLWILSGYPEERCGPLTSLGFRIATTS